MRSGRLLALRPQAKTAKILPRQLQDTTRAAMNPSASSQGCTVFLVRHGATNSNLATPPILQGRAIDDPLSATGQTQASHAARQLASVSLAAVYSSPLRRAQETAQAIADPHQLLVRTAPEITEVDVGRWERLSWEHIAREEPEAFRNFQSDPGRYGYPEGESLADVSNRVVPAFRAIAAQHAGQSIAIVGHNVVNRAFLASALELPLARARNIHQANCCINVLEWQADAWKVVAINSIFHLPPS